MHGVLREFLSNGTFTGVVVLFLISIVCVIQLACFWRKRDLGWWINFILNGGLIIFAIPYLAVKIYLVWS